MPEAGHFAVDGPVEAADVEAAGVEIDCRQAVVRARHHQIRVGHHQRRVRIRTLGARQERGRVLQHLVVLHARRQAPEFAAVIAAQFAQQLAFGTGGDGLGKIAGIIVVRGLAHAPAIRQAGRQRLRVGRIDRVAVGVAQAVVRQIFDIGFAAVAAGLVLADVARVGAELHAAPLYVFRIQGQVAVGGDVDVVRHRQLDPVLRRETGGRRQPAGAARARQRKRDRRRAQDRHILEIHHGLAAGADVAPGIQVQRARLQVPIRIRPLARAVGAVDDNRLFLVDEVDALGLALAVALFDLIGRVQHEALAGLHVQLEHVAGIEVAEAPQAHIAVGVDLILDLLVARRVGRQAGLVAHHLGVAFQRDFTLRATGDDLGAHRGRGVLVLDVGALALGVGRHRGGGDEGAQGKRPALRRWGGCKPAHEKQFMKRRGEAPWQAIF